MATQDRKPRQAVVVIHGIGEQRPMKTLRKFVGALLAGRNDADGEPRFYSKPDRLTDTLELRRLATWPPHVPVSTDFYELYWAHLMPGTDLARASSSAGPHRRPRCDGRQVFRGRSLDRRVRQRSSAPCLGACV